MNSSERGALCDGRRHPRGTLIPTLPFAPFVGSGAVDVDICWRPKVTRSSANLILIEVFECGGTDPVRGRRSGWSRTERANSPRGGTIR